MSFAGGIVSDDDDDDETGADAEVHNVHDIILAYKNSLDDHPDKVIEQSDYVDHHQLNLKATRQDLQAENVVNAPISTKTNRLAMHR